MALAPSFDSLGAFARSVSDLDLLLDAWGVGQAVATPARPRFGWCRTPLWDLVEPGYRTALDQMLGHLTAAGAEIVPLDLHAAFQPMREIHRAIFTVEALQSLHAEWTGHRDLLSPASWRRPRPRRRAYASASIP